MRISKRESVSSEVDAPKASPERATPPEREEPTIKDDYETLPGAPREPLISQAKAAEMCGMTRAAIRDLVRRQRFRTVADEGRDLVYLKEVEAFAKARE